MNSDHDTIACDAMSRAELNCPVSDIIPWRNCNFQPCPDPCCQLADRNYLRSTATSTIIGDIYVRRHLLTADPLPTIKRLYILHAFITQMQSN